MFKSHESQQELDLHLNLSLCLIALRNRESLLNWGFIEAELKKKSHQSSPIIFLQYSPRTGFRFSNCIAPSLLSDTIRIKILYVGIRKGQILLSITDSKSRVTPLNSGQLHDSDCTICTNRKAILIFLLLPNARIASKWCNVHKTDFELRM